MEITLAVAAVALAAWDGFRRWTESRKVDDRGELESAIKAVHDRVTTLDIKITQFKNRGALSGLPKRRQG